MVLRSLPESTSVTGTKSFSTCVMASSCSTQVSCLPWRSPPKQSFGLHKGKQQPYAAHSGTERRYGTPPGEARPYKQSWRKIRPQSAALFSSLPRSASSVRAAMAALRTTLGARLRRLANADSPAKDTILSRTNACAASRAECEACLEIQGPRHCSLLFNDLSRLIQRILSVFESRMARSEHL